MWGEFLCAGCEVELVVCSSKDASGVGVELYMNDLWVVCTADVDETMKLDASRALKGGEHGVCVGVFE